MLDCASLPKVLVSPQSWQCAPAHRFQCYGLSDHVQANSFESEIVRIVSSQGLANLFHVDALRETHSKTVIERKILDGDLQVVNLVDANLIGDDRAGADEAGQDAVEKDNHASKREDDIQHGDEIGLFNPERSQKDA